jgi:hypothetical protein
MRGSWVLGFIACFLLLSGYCHCQNKPGIEGMVPSKWITLRNTQAPGRSYRTLTSQNKVYTQEDVFFKMWLPVVHTQKFSLALGPQYRTEQLELQSDGENAIHMLSNWNLRYASVDMKGMVSLDSTSWLVFGGNVNKSGNFNNYSFKSFPFNYTASAAWLRKTSANKEYGAGLIVNKSFTGITILPILIYHYNFSKKTGVELSIPYKMAFRYNLTSSDIISAKAEAANRNYMIRLDDSQCSFRRIDVDMGIAYNKSFGKLIGIEAFAGYRQNISNRLPPEVVAVKKSGMAFSLELYIRPPVK